MISIIILLYCKFASVALDGLYSLYYMISVYTYYIIHLRNINAKRSFFKRVIKQLGGHVGVYFHDCGLMKQNDEAQK